MAPPTLLEVRGLRARYEHAFVLHGIDLDVVDGGVTAILGANGAGKTTLLRAICGMVSTTGEVRFDGRDIRRTATHRIARLGVAHVPDGRGTFLELTVEENLRVGGCARRDHAGARADVERMYSYFPRLAERRRQQAGTLSGGEQQMLAIARALMSKPRLLLLDEPSFGLAPVIVEQVFAMLRLVNANEHVSLLLVEQNAALALDLADHAFVMETGRVVLAGPADVIRGDDSVRRSYLGY